MAAGQTPIMIEGGEQLATALKALPSRIANRVVKQSLRAAMKPIHRAAVAATPVGKPGAMFRSVKTSVAFRKEFGRVAINRVARQRARGHIRLRKGVFVEHRFGTLKRNVKLRAMRRSRVRQGMMITSGDPRTGRLNTGEAYYGAFVHWGHGIGKSLRIRALQQRAVRARKRGQSDLAIQAQIAREDTRGRTRANPWLRDTFNRMKDQMMRGLIQAMRIGIVREAAALGKLSK